MKKLIATLLLAVFSLSTFAAIVQQQDTTKKHHKEKSKPLTKKKKWTTKKDTSGRDTTKHIPVKKDTLHIN